MRPQAIVLGSGFALLALLALTASRGEGPMPHGSKILLVGDSLAGGLRAPLRKIAEASGYLFDGRAIVGSRIDAWTERAAAETLRFGADLVLVSLGTNDAAMSAPEKNQSAARALAASVEEAGARLFWIGPPTLPPRLLADRVYAMLDGVAPILDSRPMRFERAADGVHATPEGYAAWAEQIASTLRARGVLR